MSTGLSYNWKFVPFNHSLSEYEFASESFMSLCQALTSDFLPGERVRYVRQISVNDSNKTAAQNSGHLN